LRVQQGDSGQIHKEGSVIDIGAILFVAWTALHPGARLTALLRIPHLGIMRLAHDSNARYAEMPIV
jgi:hypothetical protein